MTATGSEFDVMDETYRARRQALLREKIEVLQAHLRAGLEVDLVIICLQELAETEAELRGLTLTLARRGPP